MFSRHSKSFRTYETSVNNWRLNQKNCNSQRSSTPNKQITLHSSAHLQPPEVDSLFRDDPDTTNKVLWESLLDMVLYVQEKDNQSEKGFKHKLIATEKGAS